MYNRVFSILRASLPQQLADAGVRSIRDANGFLQSYWGKLNRFVAIEPKQSTAFEPLKPRYEAEIVDILCLHERPEVGTNNGAGNSNQGQPVPSTEVNSSNLGATTRDPT